MWFYWWVIPTALSCSPQQMVSSNGQRRLNQSLWRHFFLSHNMSLRVAKWPYQIYWLEAHWFCSRKKAGEDLIIPKVLQIHRLLFSYSENLWCVSFYICLPLLITHMDGGGQVQKQPVQPPGSECDWVLRHPVNMCNKNGQNGGGVHGISIPSLLSWQIYIENYHKLKNI